MSVALPRNNNPVAYTIMSKDPMHVADKKCEAANQSRDLDGDTLASQDIDGDTLKSQDIRPEPKRSNPLRGSLRRLLRKDKDTEPRRQPSDEPESSSRRKSSISDSGPYTLVRDPVTGKEVLHRNPHWPNEDSWKKEKESEGTWAFGSMMGQKLDDFGGTVG